MTTEEHLKKIVAKCRELLAVDAGSDRAKAGWRATIAACELYFYSRNFAAHRQVEFNIMADQIKSAWPDELL